jgi:hypothetical protein
VSVAPKNEGCLIEMMEGWERRTGGVDGSKRVVIAVGVAEDVADDGAVSV